MQKISLSQAKHGMVLAEPVLSDSGITLVEAGEEVTEPLLSVLKQKGIKKIVVEGHSVTVDPSSKPPEELEKELVERFSNVESDPVMMKMKDLFIAKIHSHPADQEVQRKMKKPPEIEEVIKERDAFKKSLSDITVKYVEKIEDLSLIRSLGDALKDITDFPGMCKSIVAIIQREIAPDNCALMIVDEVRDELVLKATKGPYDDEAGFIEEGRESTRFRIGENIAGLVAREGKPILIPDALRDDRFLKTKNKNVEIKSLISIPLIAGERVIGVLNLSHGVPDTFNEDHVRVLSIIANSAAVALENTRLYQRLSESRDRLARENINLRNELKEKFAPDNIVGSSKSFREILLKMEKVSGANVNVLITGESGTGKELIAKMIHYNSPRSKGPFVAVNCAALPENLLESELFGIEKGVATGVEKRIGKFELADGGTIFLDEIGDMSFPTQAKILRVLQEKEFQRVGGNRAMKLDIRIVSATNKDLEKDIREENFREDLYYRLKVVQLNIPPLRKRKDDIPLLANHFLRIYCEKHGAGEKKFSRQAMEFMMGAPWRGNVRELENVVEQAVILSDGQVIRPPDLWVERRDEFPSVKVFIPDDRIDFKDTMREVYEKAEGSLIFRVLERTNNNKSKAAKILGIGRRTLINKLNKLKE